MVGPGLKLRTLPVTLAGGVRLPCRAGWDGSTYRKGGGAMESTYDELADEDEDDDVGEASMDWVGVMTMRCCWSFGVPPSMSRAVISRSWIVDQFSISKLWGR